ncbi:Lactate utilization protein A [Aliiroseovarius sp. xm-m-379]|uniref:glycolate oxidase subunit GlcF n=1 Tax=unclassified Aliiroseovarius TaxID=2623558 RepID=UPI001569C146|nr:MULTISPECIES: glycolate oxidase subunit GlcF [unclassified Aliiroseovarius]NRP14238.1 Lactate utilization protein A [Aliiroseovarius sp. xm-d-517]NRP23722.1 Lactate utilization protein A [Aliiroseovarius sp. xm-m-379]NRP29031.1 Lactate utilization protein A [Aliiroseovarius sp. xm-m-314]NRP32521.1 Lactate utilization protein A [Aliiroseovarius sp. xm-a-104]NRP41054.1 Lactate utilization protein A [Aliiroseovarius sp. xm-m-339-2]
MQTHFTEEQLKDPAIERANEILRACVHCGFCTATCPSYQVLGDELDSPRGRIYLIKDMLEAGRPADARTVEHVDRCLSCLACMSTCPSGVHYMHLIDHARAHIEKTYRRPFLDRLLRWALAKIIPFPRRFRAAMTLARAGRPLRGLLPDPRLRAMLEMAPPKLPRPSANDQPQVFPAKGARRKRVALLTGCAQKALDTDINDATIRLLTRLGCEVVIARDMGCCGALTHHMGKEEDSHAQAARNIRAWMAEHNTAGLDAIVINTSGCGTTVKDYAHIFRNAPLAEDAAKVSELACDVTELLMELELPERQMGLRVAYHSACSLQHGQQVKTPPRRLLERAGFEVVDPKDPHLCCGSAGIYNILQPDISAQLKARKIETLEARAPQVIAAGNIGCMLQIGSGTEVPVVHTVELLDWATGGPQPRKLIAL